MSALTLVGTSSVCMTHAVSRKIASNERPTVDGLTGSCAAPGNERYGWRKGFRCIDVKNQGSARKSPVCRTFPRAPSIRYLHAPIQTGLYGSDWKCIHDRARTVISIQQSQHHCLCSRDRKFGGSVQWYGFLFICQFSVSCSEINKRTKRSLEPW